jgi:hypothetical protein
MSDSINDSVGNPKLEGEAPLEEKSIFEDDEPIASSFMEVGERVLQYTSQAFVMGSIVGLVLVKVPTDATSHGTNQLFFLLTSISFYRFNLQYIIITVLILKFRHCIMSRLQNLLASTG